MKTLILITAICSIGLTSAFAADKQPGNKKEASVGNGSMVMILADSQESVKELYDKALELGASDEGAPDERAGGKIYAAYIRELDGNKIGFLHRPKS